MACAAGTPPIYIPKQVLNEVLGFSARPCMSPNLPVT